MPKAMNKRKNKKQNKKTPSAKRSKAPEIKKEPVVSAADIGNKLENENIEKGTGYNNGEIVFSWETVDFIKKPITEFYLTAAVFGAMLMIGWGLYNRSFVMVATFIMMAVMIILVLSEEPKKVKVKISEKGIGINDERHRFSEFKSFKISHMDELPVLILKQRKSLLPFMTVYIEDEPVNDLESFLEIYLEQEE